MKKILSVFAVLIVVAVSFATAPSTTVNLSSGDYKLLYTYTTRVAVTGADSATILPKMAVPELGKGWFYVAVINDSVNAAADSVSYRADVYMSDESTIGSSYTIGKGYASASRVCHYIPIGQSLFGKSFRIRMIKGNATTVVASKRVEIYGFRSIGFTRSGN